MSTAKSIYHSLKCESDALGIPNALSIIYVNESVQTWILMSGADRKTCEIVSAHFPSTSTRQLESCPSKICALYLARLSELRRPCSRPPLQWANVKHLQFNEFFVTEFLNTYNWPLKNFKSSQKTDLDESIYQKIIKNN